MISYNFTIRTFIKNIIDYIISWLLKIKVYNLHIKLMSPNRYKLIKLYNFILSNHDIIYLLYFYKISYCENM